jgi:tellurite resistance protein TehA-like permease
MSPPPRAGGPIERILASIPPASGAVVMGTGIDSIDLSLDNHETLSGVLLGIAIAVWIALGLLLAARVLFNRERVHREARSPAALTGVAGTAVLGTRLTLVGSPGLGIGLLVIALAFWAALLAPVLRNWVTPTVGVSLVLVVSTESLAVLAATLSIPKHAAWLMHAALVPFGLGLCFYVFVITRFDFRQLAVGHGDHWITGGALAISTLAAGRITLAQDALHSLSGIHELFKGISLALWGITMLWLPVLVAVEVLHPRLRYDARRWSTVFPVGMYAACSFVVGSAAGAAALTDFAQVWIWVALAVWAIVATGTVRRGIAVARGS